MEGTLTLHYGSATSTIEQFILLLIMAL